MFEIIIKAVNHNKEGQIFVHLNISSLFAGCWMKIVLCFLDVAANEAY